MLPRESIERFLARPRHDLRKYKRVSDAWIENAVTKLKVRPPIWNKLRRPQKIGLLVGAMKKRLAFFYDMGTGKTFMSVALARYFRKAKIGSRFLVLVPSRVNKTEWAEELEKHSPSTSFRILSGTSKQKWDELRNGENITITIETYGGLTRMLSSKVVSKRKDKKHQLKPDRKKVKELAGLFDGMFLDESHNVMTYGSTQTRLCRALAKRWRLVFPLTGTPFGRDPIALWPQVQLVDNGYTLGETMALFRESMFHKVKNGYGGFDWKFNKKQHGVLHRMLAHSVLEWQADEADLPALVPIVKTVYLPEMAEIYYERAKRRILESNGNLREIQNAFTRMRQISSGFVGFKDDNTGARAEFEFDENPKLEMLMSQLRSLPRGGKAIVFHDFQWSAKRIAKELQDADIGHVLINGKVRDVDAAKRAFTRDPEKQILVLSNDMATGLNLQVAQRGFYYESPVPVIERHQTLRRFRRQDSAHKTVFLIDLVVRGTVDESILEYHKEGADLFQAIVRGEVPL